MKEHRHLIKNLVIGIIILLIGAGIVPSISGYTGNTINKLTDEDLSNLLMNANYLNAYWKFDENSGNIAHDSSGHNYDGLINGATWTSGYSNYALLYDGINDFVNLSNYAQNYLGFNRTDDLKYTFYFKTSSTKKGYIYSTMRGDSYGLNPGFRISLRSDGKFEVQMWRLNCGILMNSNNSYNDGAWHKAEIFFNGGTAHCLVEIYVDGIFDSSYQKYICSFYADNFRYAHMGRDNFEVTDFFEGKIDEFEIIKYPEGNQQILPTIDGPILGQPFVEYDYTFVSNDPEDDDVSYFVDWDDGTTDGWTEYHQSGEIVTLSHKWNEEGRYIIKAQCKDSWGHTGWSEYEVRIGNQAPDPPVITGQKYGNAGQELTYTFSAFDYEGQNVKYYINWGDGSTDETIFYPHNTPIELSHSWATEGDYYITAFAEDTTGRDGDPSEYHIRLGDQPPNSPGIYGAVQAKPGIEYEYGFVSSDPEDDNIKYDINWGDGTIETDLGPSLSGEFFSWSHIWEDAGSYTIKVRAKDDFDNPSGWSEHKIFVYTKNKAFNSNLLYLMFEQFPNLFRSLRYIITMGGEFI